MRADRTPRPPPPPTPLPAGTRLGRYELRKVLGIGRYGIVYRARDTEHDSELAIKEYLPRHLAQRDSPDGPLAVAPRGPAEAEAFAQGQRFFLAEGRLLARCKHPSLIDVEGAWAQNGTAYLAMELATGRDLKATVQARWRPPGDKSMRALLECLLGALDVVHQAGFQHRDVVPQNVMLEPDGRPLLMDLGSPRRVAMAQGTRDGSGVREGYAPLELYRSHEALPRGPWTDLYMLAATLHFLMSGQPPTAAPGRSTDDHPGLGLKRSDKRHSVQLLSVLDWMLALQPQQRPQSVAEVRAALAGRQPVPAAHRPARRLGRRWLWGLAALLAATGAIAAAWWLWHSGVLARLR